MKNIARRDFLKGSLVSAAGFSLPLHLLPAGWGQAPGANGDIRVGVVGIRSKGRQHINVFRKMPGVKVVAICDPDRNILSQRAKEFAKRKETVATYVDVRKLLDDQSIDAIVVASPNHWHSLMTIWACQAGKDVYVEKPPCHNIFEGQQMVASARKYNRIVQTGTQNRSDTGLIPAMEYIHAGKLGPIKYVHGLCYKRRKSIGKVTGPQPIPAGVDYNLWTGPAPLVPLRRRSLHYDWHWDWPTGNGDVGNQGPHELDACLWALNQEVLPQKVISVGGRLGYVDDATTPNSLVTVFDYKPAPLIFEVRGLANNSKPKAAMDHYHGKRIGIVVFCEGGYFAGGRGGGWIYDKEGKKVKKFPGDGGAGHPANFIAAMRSRKISDLKADIAQGVRSANLAHMANISYRLGQNQTPDATAAALKDAPRGGDAWARMHKHFDRNEIDLAKTPITVGPWLDFDLKSGRFKGEGEYHISRWANALLTRNYRKPFIVPNEI